MEAITIHHTLDRRGKTVTTFVIYDAAEQLATMAEGEVLEVITDDFEPFRADIATWCQATGQRLARTESTTAGLRFLIEKQPARAKDTSLAMVISSDGLEELLSPLGFALAAALEGIDVNLYFQGPAVRVLSPGFRPKLRGWSRPFSRFAEAGMRKTGHIPAKQKLVQLRNLGAHFYICGASMPHFKVTQDELIFDDLPLVEYFTFMAIMERADIQLYI
ncbi:MAG: DsrE family protein [Myxococcales bacterium]|nr:DsrE family protein [Myxococcales bacterium]